MVAWNLPDASIETHLISPAGGEREGITDKESGSHGRIMPRAIRESRIKSQLLQELRPMRIGLKWSKTRIDLRMSRYQEVANAGHGGREVSQLDFCL